MAMCVMAVVAVAPCQCFSPGGNQITSPGRISSTGPPQRCARPQPAVTIRVWPSGCVCQAVRAPGSNVTAALATRAGSGAWKTGSMRTVPVNHSAGPLPEGCEPLLLMSTWPVSTCSSREIVTAPWSLSEGRRSAWSLGTASGRPSLSYQSRHRSSVVELSIRNRAVVGSNPTGGSGGPEMPRRSGLTLIEILVVLILMGLVAVLVSPTPLPRHPDQSAINALLGSAREVAARRGEVVYVHVDPTGQWRVGGGGRPAPGPAPPRRRAPVFPPPGPAQG